MDIIVPQVGESIVEAEIGEWFKKDGDYVAKDELLMELETEKVNVELNAEAAGVLKITAQQGETVKIGAVIGTIDESAEETPPPAATTADKPESSEDSAPPEEETAATPGTASISLFLRSVNRSSKRRLVSGSKRMEPTSIKMSSSWSWRRRRSMSS